MRKPLVEMKSIVDNHELKAVNKVIIRKGGEKLAKTMPKTVKKLP